MEQTIAAALGGGAVGVDPLKKFRCEKRSLPLPVCALSLCGDGHVQCMLPSLFVDCGQIRSNRENELFGILGGLENRVVYPIIDQLPPQM